MTFSRWGLVLASGVLMGQAAATLRPPTLTIADLDHVTRTGAAGTAVRQTSGGDVKHVRFSPDGSRIYFDRTYTGLKIADAATGKLLQEHKFPGFSANSLALSADGKTLASGTNTGKVVTMHAENAEPLQEFAIGRWSVYGMAISANGALIAADPEDAPVQIWDAAKQTKLRELNESRPDKGTRMDNICFSPDSKLLATFRRDNVVELWETDTGKRIGEHSGPGMNSEGRVQFTADGLNLIATGADVMLWNVKTGAVQTTTFPDEIDQRKLFDKALKEINSKPFDGRQPTSPEMVWENYVSSDGSLVASRQGNRNIVVWEGKTATIVDRLEPSPTAAKRSDGATEIAWSPDGKRICCANKDGTVDVWDLK